MKVTVKDRYLNVRVGKPLLTAASYQYIAPGSQIEVDGKLYKGDAYDNNTNWLKDAANNYYWAGGVSGLPNDPLTVSGKTTFGWFNSLNIEQVWQNYKTQGAGVKVAVLDSGYSVNNQALNQKIKPASTKIFIAPPNYTSDDLVIDDQDSDRHGTRCASLVGALNNQSYIVGVAPATELLIAKTSVGEEFIDHNYLLAAIDWAIAQGADIITASFGFALAQDIAVAFDQHIKTQTANKNVLLFAAAGNTSGTPKEIDYYPACLPSFISVGATSASGSVSAFTALNDKTVIHAPGEKIESYGKGNIPTPMDGTSFSTPIVAGIAALAVSYLKLKNGGWDSTDLQNKIYASGDLIAGTQGKKLLNPIKLFQTL